MYKKFFYMYKKVRNKLGDSLFIWAILYSAILYSAIPYSAIPYLCSDSATFFLLIKVS